MRVLLRTRPGYILRPLRVLVALGILASLAGPVRAQNQTAQPIARATLSPSTAVTVGQPVTIEVEVLVPSFFRGAPRFADLDIADALVIFNDRGRNVSERIEGRTWAGQARSYTVYPQRAGSYEVVGEVEVTYADGSNAVTATVSADPVRFDATVPAAAAGLDYFIATSSLQLDESIEVPPATEATTGTDSPGAAAHPEEPQNARAGQVRTLRVGDSLTRTVTVTVDDALSMVVPPLDLGSTDGLADYPSQPLVSDTTGERAARVVGTRTESTTFVAEREGRYTLPPVELSWWDVDENELRSARADEIVIEVVANPDLAVEIAVPPDDPETVASTGDTAARISVIDTLKRWGPWALFITAALYAAMRAVRRFGPAVEALVLGDAADREAERRFRAFRRAAHAQDAAATARSFMQWLDFRNQKPGTYGGFAQEARDPGLAEEARALGDSLYGPPGEAREWSGRVLVNGVDRARHRRHQRARPKRPALPPINP